MNAERLIPMMQSDVTGQGEPLVLLPGGLTGWLSWIPHAEHWSKTRQVIRLQLLSVELGLSGTALPDGYGVEFEVEALSNTLAKLDIAYTDFAAWSYGGAVALSFALRNPEQVRSLTLIEPEATWVLRIGGSLPLELREEQKQMQSLSTSEITEDQLAWFTRIAGLIPADTDPRSLPGWPVWSKHRQSLRMGDAPYRHVDSLERVRNFQKLVLLVKGAGSTARDHLITDRLVEAFPIAQVETLPGGHAAHIISMAAFLELFDRFMLRITDG